MNAQYEQAGLYTCEIQSASGGMKDDAQVYINGEENVLVILCPRGIKMMINLAQATDANA